MACRSSRSILVLPLVCLALLDSVASFRLSLPSSTFRRQTSASPFLSLRPSRLPGPTRGRGIVPKIALRGATSNSRGAEGQKAAAVGGGDLLKLAVEILNTPCPDDKARLTLEARRRWAAGELRVEEGPAPPKSCPSEPARPDYVPMVASNKMQVKSRLALIHSLCHAESYAIDLMWHMMAAFHGEGMPREFYDDWTRVAADEARHYTVWRDRLRELGTDYGAMNSHRGLWESADDTAHDLLARLAIVHMVHEARGLDVFAQCEAKMLRAHPPDHQSAEILRANYEDEITHVRAGVRWFAFLCEKRGISQPAHEVFHTLVRKHFGTGTLKPPFDREARALAGMAEEWYEPISAGGPGGGGG